MTDLSLSAPTLDKIRARRDEVLRLSEQHGAISVRVFGSVAREEADFESDVDFLVDFQPGTSMWDVIGLWQDLSDLFGCDVSVVTESTLEGSFKQNVLRDAVPL
jgi:predicted nucleotidyltransferase